MNLGEVGAAIVGGLVGGGIGYQAGYTKGQQDLQPYIAQLELQNRVKDIQLSAKDQRITELENQLNVKKEPVISLVWKVLRKPFSRNTSS